MNLQKMDRRHTKKMAKSRLLWIIQWTFWMLMGDSCGCEKPKILCKKCSKFSLFNVCRHYLAIFSRDVCEKHRVCVFGDLISSKLWFMCVKWENFTLWKYKKSHLMLFTVKSLQFDKESPTRDSKFFFLLFVIPWTQFSVFFSSFFK